MKETSEYLSDAKEDTGKVDGALSSRDDGEVSIREGEIINASGHRDQLKRHYGLLSICGLALTVDNAWIALGTSLTVAISKVFSNGQSSPLMLRR